MSILAKAPRLDDGKSSSSTLLGAFGGELRVIDEEAIEQVFRSFPTRLFRQKIARQK